MLTLGKAEGFSLVVALDALRGIGLKGKLPWRLTGDMRFFRELTTCPDRAAVESRYGLNACEAANEPVAWDAFQEQIKSQSPLPLPTPNCRNAVLMGRRTWESLPEGFKPLPNRLNGVLSREGKGAKMGTHQVWNELQPALESLGRDESVREIFVMGGAQIYAEALRSPACERIYVTDVEGVFGCDVFFPEVPGGFREFANTRPIVENGTRYRFRILRRDLS